MAGKKKSESPENKKKTGTAKRDSKGRFVKGQTGNPSGRPKIPDELREYGRDSFKRLRQIADDPETPIKVKADIERWFAEMSYGKARQQLDVEGNMAMKPVIFEGEDDIRE